ncbi:hypothetical protein DF3PA_250027 [Candidatus Defluviicoccus seviourii]|uniref:Uncharacterized protein n=2 Tax=root TaxID=1 RepID=A0A564WER3_9PROT|nr:hypothetical protein DF3PB_280003 [uncultured Defluviicoccus sp.]VUX46619.1 hypothetical protein DF3PA_250027 [Candidatus Defluviicoccus seviourii]
MGFNEAAALLPREGPRHRKVPRHRHLRFNEAAALLPREGANGSVSPPLSDKASMRPRHYCRGREKQISIERMIVSIASMRPRHYCRGRGV